MMAYSSKLVALNTIKGIQDNGDTFKIVDLRDGRFIELPMAVLTELRDRENEILDYMRRGEFSTVIEVANNYSVKTEKFKADVYDERARCYRRGDVHVITFQQGTRRISIIDVTLCKFLQVPAKLASRNSPRMSYVILNTIKDLEIYYDDVFRLIDSRDGRYVELPVAILQNLRDCRTQIVNLMRNDQRLTVLDRPPYRVETGYYDGGDVNVIRFYVNRNMISIVADTFCEIFKHLF